MKTFKELMQEIQSEDYGTAWNKLKSGASEIGSAAKEAGQTFVKDLPDIKSRAVAVGSAAKAVAVPAIKKAVGNVAGATGQGAKAVQKWANEDIEEAAAVLSAPSSVAVSKTKAKSGGTRKTLPGPKTSTPRLSGPASTVSKAAPYQTLARGIAPVSSMVSGSGEFEKGTKMSGKSKLSDRLSSVRKSVESGAARGTAIGAMSGLPRTAMVSGVLGGVSGGVSNAFGQLAQQKGEKIEKSVNKAITPTERATRDIQQNKQRAAELKNIGKEKSGLNKSMNLNTKLDTTQDKLNTVFGRPEQKAASEVRNIGGPAATTTGGSSRPSTASKPAPKPIQKPSPSAAPKPATQKPIEKKSVPVAKPAAAPTQSSADMDDLRASAQKLRAATSDLTKKTGEWKSLQKPTSSSIQSQMKDVAASEPTMGRQAFPSSAKFPNQSVFSKVAGK